MLCESGDQRTTWFPGSLILPPHKASEERPWHALFTCHFNNGKLQGGVLCNQAIGRVGPRRTQSIALCCDRQHQRWSIIFSFQAKISNSIYSNVCLKVKQVCLEAIYRDHYFMLLPSYPLYLWKVSHTSTFDVEQRNFIPH